MAQFFSDIEKTSEEKKNSELEQLKAKLKENSSFEFKGIMSGFDYVLICGLPLMSLLAVSFMGALGLIILIIWAVFLINALARVKRELTITPEFIKWKGSLGISCKWDNIHNIEYLKKTTSQDGITLESDILIRIIQKSGASFKRSIRQFSTPGYMLKSYDYIREIINYYYMMHIVKNDPDRINSLLS